MLKGSLVAIVTPMSETGEIDYGSFDKLIDWHIDEGTQGIVVAGTTGESPTLSIDEHARLIQYSVDYVAGRVPVIAGTGANSTSEAIELASFAKSAGADYSLSVVPYYNKPSQEGLFEHFRAIAEKVDMQHILYNVPGRTVASLSNDTILKLSAIDNIVGVKDATGDMVVGIDLLNRRPDDFLVFSGDDATFMALMMLGADGVISVTANVVPSLVQKICDHVGASEYQDARAANYLISDMNVALFLEANPIPVKWALAQMGKIKPNLRLPLTVLEQNLHTVVAASLRHAGVQVEFIQN